MTFLFTIFLLTFSYYLLNFLIHLVNPFSLNISFNHPIVLYFHFSLKFLIPFCLSTFRSIFFSLLFHFTFLLNFYIYFLFPRTPLFLTSFYLLLFPLNFIFLLSHTPSTFLSTISLNSSLRSHSSSFFSL